MSFASNTSVSPEKTQFEIQKTLGKYGCERFGVMTESNRAFVLFTYEKLNIQIEVPIPPRNLEKYKLTPSRRQRRSDTQAIKAWEQDVRSRWRKLLLAIKAKLEAVESGISTLETEFMPFIVMCDGATLGQHLLPMLKQRAEAGQPLMLEAMGGGE